MSAEICGTNQSSKCVRVYLCVCVCACERGRERERVLQNVIEGVCYQSLSVSHICTMTQIKMEKQHRGGFIFQNLITKTSYSANLSGDLCFWGGFCRETFDAGNIAGAWLWSDPDKVCEED